MLKVLINKEFLNLLISTFFMSVFVLNGTYDNMGACSIQQVEVIPPATFEPPVRTFGATIPALESRAFR